MRIPPRENEGRRDSSVLDKAPCEAMTASNFTFQNRLESGKFGHGKGEVRLWRAKKLFVFYFQILSFGSCGNVPHVGQVLSVGPAALLRLS